MASQLFAVRFKGPVCSRMIQIDFLAPELGDPAVRRHADMFEKGGAKVRLVGFVRERTGPPKGTFETQVLGRTENGRFLRRTLTVLRAFLAWPAQVFSRPAPDLVVARNLEMLLLAAVYRLRGRRGPTIVYECLDVHRLMLGTGPVSLGLRLLERMLLRLSHGVIVSWPAAETEYLRKRQGYRGPVIILENWVFDPSYTKAAALAARTPATGRPWRIGWSGILRCRKSLAFLEQVATALPDTVVIVLRGLPADDQLPDFEAVLSRTPNLRYGGPYRYPQDLAEIFGSIDFVWAIDLYEEGLNSRWLLPNRLYEGMAYGAVPLVAEGVATAAWAAARGVGVELSGDLGESLIRFLSDLTLDHHQSLADAVAARPTGETVANDETCGRLVERMMAMAHGGAG